MNESYASYSFVTIWDVQSVGAMVSRWLRPLLR